MTGKGVGGEIAKSSGAFFFIWTIIALGVTALISVILSVRGLWSLRRTTPSMRRPVPVNRFFWSFRDFFHFFPFSQAASVATLPSALLVSDSRSVPVGCS
jgi:hypothetical protein